MCNKCNTKDEVLKAFIDNLVVTSSINNDEDLINLRDNTINMISKYFSEYLTPNCDTDVPLDFISSDKITIEIKDKETNRYFRRTLDISYIENSNGLKLTGENLKGQPSDIVFFSDTAINKINDVTGRGLNKARCND